MSGCRDCDYLERAKEGDKHIPIHEGYKFSFPKNLDDSNDVCNYSEKRIPVMFSDGGVSRLWGMGLRGYDGQIGCENYKQSQNTNSSSERDQSSEGDGIEVTVS